MRRGHLGHGTHLRGHREATVDEQPEFGHDEEFNEKFNKGALPTPLRRSGAQTVAIPVRKVLSWLRYLTGAACIIVLLVSLVSGDHVGKKSADIVSSSLGSKAALRRSLGSTSSSQSSSSQSSSHGNCGGHHGASRSLDSTLSFLFFNFLACSLLHHFNSYVPFEWRFPISVVMFIAGGCVGVFFTHVTDADSPHMGNGFDTLIDGVQAAAHTDPHALLYIVLPPLLYESASAMDWHVLRKLIPSAVLLAVPGVMLNTFLTGCFVRVVVRVGNKAPKWEESWLLGSILSATDPVAVVAALAELGAPKKLSSLVEGESLLNDGSAVVCALVFLDWSSKPNSDKNCEGDPPNAGCVFGFFLQVAVGGAAIGAAVGIVLLVWLTLARNLNFPALEMAIIFIAVYGTFFVAEALHTSGVLAVVALGFLMSAGLMHKMSHDGRHLHHAILTQVGYFCNQVAFFIAGIVSSRFMYVKNPDCSHTAHSGQAWGELIGLYFVIHLTRAMVIFSFWPFLKKMGYGITWKEACIMVYGGLRGAVAVVMGLIVEHNKYVDPDTAQMVAFHTSGIVLLTLFFNGSCIDGLYRNLKMYPQNHFRMTHLRKALYRLETNCQKGGISQICRDWFFHDCHFRKLLRCVPNFSHIDFNAAGVPVPVNIDPVSMTLRTLAVDAHRKSVAEREGCNNLDFRVKWGMRKLETEQQLTALMSSSSHLTEKKDTLLHITNTGDRILDYHLSESKAQAGFYISTKAAEELLADEHDVEASIDFKIIRTDKAAVCVGFVVEEDSLYSCRPCAEQVLGTSCENSIGFNCHSCELYFNSPNGNGFVETNHPPLTAGDTVCLSFHRQPNSDWEVVISLKTKAVAESETILSVPFGPFTPAELYPIVEFRHTDPSKMSSGLLSNPSATLSNVPSEKTAHSPEKSAHLPGAMAAAAAVTEAASEAMNTSSNKVLHVAKHGIEAVTDLGSRLVKKAKGQDDESPQHTSDVAKCHIGAKVELSFEPQLASDADSINELFHVLFNTVTHHYMEYHEHGVICDTALSWLCEAVGAASDCASHEVNAMQASDFRMISRGMSAVTRDTNGTPEKRLSKFSWSRVNSGVRKSRNLVSKFAQMRSDSMQAKVVGLFEPLIVEYLSLEQEVATQSYWDRFPKEWQRTRMFGFRNTRAKVEAVWAYVEAHQKVLRESPVMQRFPDLVKCIDTLAGQAKQDLASLQEIQPRRFYYSKHILALRKILNGRLAKLKTFTNEGWISMSDASVLQDILFERIVQAEQYYPSGTVSKDRVMVSGHPSTPRGLSLNLNSWSGLFADDAANAWSDFQLPSMDPAVSERAVRPGTAEVAIVIPAVTVDGSASNPNTVLLSPANGAPRAQSLNRLQLEGPNCKRDIVVRVKSPHASRAGLLPTLPGGVKALSTADAAAQAAAAFSCREEPKGMSDSAEISEPSDNMVLPDGVLRYSHSNVVASESDMLEDNQNGELAVVPST